MPALYAEPGHLIRRAHQTAVAVFYGVQGRQVTPVQYAILRALLDHPGIDQVTLAGLVDLDTSTTADIAVRLEQKGWIVRERLPRRQRSLCLTEAGRGLLLAMLQKAQTMSAQLLQPLEAAEQAELMRLLRQLLRLPAQAAPAHRDNP
ncbi:MarR family transcriptional regulator [Serpentinimonas barnesii]|uniref:MarR family transcriptional regulator n=1 Tax=Serpentinimonas barnesii TaxID=1458427 RepID=UPI000494F471|nr:MarR family transcriptional regulator [Serpentinimonas barnesii]